MKRIFITLPAILLTISVSTLAETKEDSAKKAFHRSALLQRMELESKNVKLISQPKKGKSIKK